MNLAFDLHSPVFFKTEALTESEMSMHSRALSRARDYRLAEASLLESVIEIDGSRLYEKFDLDSTFAYCMKYMKLSEAVVYNFITVARKASQLPVLKAAIESGELGISKARKITSVVNAENQVEWVQKAIDLPQSKLEREVVESASEKTSFEKDRVRLIKNKRAKLVVHISEAMMKDLKRAQELASKSKCGNASLEETVGAALELFLNHKDPLRKAERAQKRKKTTPPDSSRDTHMRGRKPILAAIEHQVHLRDHGSCQAKRADGSTCRSTKFTHIHHIVEVSRGGSNDVDNLLTLCSRCHRRWHRQCAQL
jgi:hypothetical protein